MADRTPVTAWLVTQATSLMKCSLGTWRDGAIVLTPLGEQVEACWGSIPALAPGVGLDVFVVMPNHLHGIVLAERAGPAIGAFKRELRRRAGEHERRWNRWRRDRALRTESDMDAARRFVAANVAHWPDHPYNYRVGDAGKRWLRFRNVPWHDWWP